MPGRVPTTYLVQAEPILSHGYTWKLLEFELIQSYEPGRSPIQVSTTKQYRSTAHMIHQLSCFIKYSSIE